MNDELGPWEPMSLADTLAVVSAGTFRWWVTGGHALELHLGRSWREHDDMDVSFVRADSPDVFRLLADWQIVVAAAGVLSPWSGESLDAAAHQNNLWCKQPAGGPWCLDLTVSEGDDEQWIFRRDASLRVGWHDAVLRSADNIPYLAPELQLLFKSRDARPRDDADAREVLPELDARRRHFLRQWLPEDHHWRRHL